MVRGFNRNGFRLTVFPYKLSACKITKKANWNLLLIFVVAMRISLSNCLYGYTCYNWAFLIVRARLKMQRQMNYFRSTVTTNALVYRNKEVNKIEQHRAYQRNLTKTKAQKMAKYEVGTFCMICHST